MQGTRLPEWKRPATIMAIIALIVSGFVAGIEIRETLTPGTTTTPTPHTTTQSILVSRGTIQLVGNGSAIYLNFTAPGSLVSAILNASFSGVETASLTRMSLLNSMQYAKFMTCNCIYAGNYTNVSTAWSSPMTHSYFAQVYVPSTGIWTLAFQHSPGGNGATENINETIALTYTTVS